VLVADSACPAASFCELCGVEVAVGSGDGFCSVGEGLWTGGGAGSDGGAGGDGSEGEGGGSEIGLF